MEIYFATSNKHKYQEAKEILSKNNTDIKHFEFKHTEIRSDSPEEIATESVFAAHFKLRKPVFVEDAGLFIDALNGFPGTYSAWVLKKLGNGGILNLLHNVKQRKAVFKTVIAYYDGKNKPLLFSGCCEGTIATEERGGSGFGYDPIFIPLGHDSTFAESIALKSELSHRYKSLLQFSKYLKER